MEIGDKVVMSVQALNQTLKGTVVYIHPEKRFFSVEFEVAGGKFRESYPMVNEKRLAKNFSKKEYISNLMAKAGGECQVVLECPKF